MPKAKQPSIVDPPPKGLTSYKYLTPGVSYTFVDKNNKSYGVATIPPKTNTTNDAPTDYLKIDEPLNTHYTYYYIDVCNGNGIITRVFIDSFYGAMMVYNKTNEKRRIRLREGSPEVEYNVYAGTQIYAKATPSVNMKNINKKCGIVSNECSNTTTGGPSNPACKSQGKPIRKPIANRRKTQRRKE